MPPPPPRLCHVCATSAAKYKCPACRSPYCSAACYKTHKEAPCGPQATTAASVATATAPAPAPPAAAAHSTTTTHAPRPPPPQKTQELEAAGVDPAQLLTAEQLGGLRASPAVLKALEDPALRTLLAKIESSGNRTKELQKALLDPSFADFMYQALDGVAVKNGGH